jgi:protein gp37
MASETGIGWTDATVNFWIGCTRCGPGCDGCYAAAWAFNKWRIVFEPGGERRPTKSGFSDPLRWQRAHERLNTGLPVLNGKLPPLWIFCNSLSDFFDKEAPAELRAQAWAVIKQCHHLRWQIVTKRIGLVERYLPDDWNGGKGYEHVGIIATMVDQDEYDRDAGKLLSLKRLGVRWTGISMEPQLGMIAPYMPTDWIITGGESRQDVWERNERGVVVKKPHETRAYWTMWAEKLIEYGAETSTPIFEKQMGDAAFDWDGKAMKLKPGGKDPMEWPAHLRVQQMPRIYDNEPARTLL